MNGRRSVRRSPPTPVIQDNQNDHDDTRGPTGSGGLQPNSWYLRNSVGSSSTSSITSSSPMSSSTEEVQENGDPLVRGPLMFTREIIERESSSTTLSAGLRTNECAQTNVLRNICNIPCLIAVTILCLPVYISRACIYVKDQITMENFIKFFLLVTVMSCVTVYYSCVCRRSFDELSSQELTQRYQTELKSVWQSHLLLEEQTHEIEALKMEMGHLHDQFSGVNKSLLHSVKQILEDSDIPGEDKEQVLKMINSAIKKIYEDHVQMSDWAQKTLGATIDNKRTSESYCEPVWNCWFIPCLVSSANPPDTVLESSVYPGNCWAFQGSEGQVVIKLPDKIYPMAVTVQHISQAIAPEGNIKSALKDFVVSGLDDETDEETLLGTFMYDIDKESIQTFQLKNQHAKQFLYIKFKVQSNWGNPVFTCIYRLRVHGKMGPLTEGSWVKVFPDE